MLGPLVTKTRNPERPSGLELWLGSWRRRQVLVWASVLLMSAISTSLLADALESMGRPVDRAYLFRRRCLDWAQWGLLFEPIARASWFFSRRVTSRLLLPLAHLVLASVVIYGVGAVDPFLSRVFVGDPAGGRGGRFERGGEREDEAELSAGERAARDERRERRNEFRSRFGARGGLSRADRGILIYLVLLGCAWSIQSFLRTRQEERRANDLQRDLAQARLTNLRHQVQPHFLFNSLHSVGGLIREGRSDVALNTLADLGGLLRAGLDQEERQEVALAEELERVEHYLEIEKLRFGERLKSTVRMDRGLAAVKVPALVLLPLVENAIKYGIAPRGEGGELELNISREGERVLLEVLDDGPGFSEEALSGIASDVPDGERRRIGLNNTRRRLEMLHGEGGRMEVSNRSEATTETRGACVRLWIPIERLP